MANSNPSSPACCDVLVIGSLGMLARDLLKRLEADGIAAVGMDLPDIDITRAQELKASLSQAAPKVVINCAAYTAVDRAESDAEAAFKVNRDGPANIADACRDLGMALVHISTDYVFDGTASVPYKEDDTANPIGVYARSKWEGEEAVRARLREHIIVRTAWLYGVHGNNFVKTIIRLAREREEIRVVADQYGCPTWAGSLAGALSEIVHRMLGGPKGTEWGTYHYCGGGKASWCDFARSIVKTAGRYEPLRARPENVVPISTSEYPTPARRPPWSVLDCDKVERTFHVAAPEWEKALEEMVAELYAAPGA